MRLDGNKAGSVLVVEDDRELATLVTACLKKEGFQVDTVHSGDEVLALVTSREYDIIVLDWMLPGKKGVEICQEYRSKGGVKGILMITGNRQTDEIEHGLDSGADDYLTKPFAMKELAARVRALLRRPQKYHGFTLQIDDLVLETNNHVVRIGDEEVHLFPREFSLLRFMMEHPGQVFSAEDLLNHVWESESDATPDSIRTNIKRIRQKIDRPGMESLLVSVHGAGYKMESRKKQ